MPEEAGGLKVSQTKANRASCLEPKSGGPMSKHKKGELERAGSRRTQASSTGISRNSTAAPAAVKVEGSSQVLPDALIFKEELNIHIS